MNRWEKTYRPRAWKPWGPDAGTAKSVMASIRKLYHSQMDQKGKKYLKHLWNRPCTPLALPNAWYRTCRITLRARLTYSFIYAWLRRDCGNQWDIMGSICSSRWSYKTTGTPPVWVEMTLKLFIKSWFGKRPLIPSVCTVIILSSLQFRGTHHKRHPDGKKSGQDNRWQGLSKSHQSEA